jgi:hypothetical protein
VLTIRRKNPLVPSSVIVVDGFAVDGVAVRAPSSHPSVIAMAV